MPQRRWLPGLVVLGLTTLLASLPAASQARRATPTVSASGNEARPGLRSVVDYLEVLAATDAHWHFDPDTALDSLSGATRLEFYGLQPILTDTLQHQFLGLSNEKLRGEWIRRYWTLRDPTPTTLENERREEHLRRVTYARQHFGQPQAPYFDARGAFLVQFGAPEAADTEFADSRPGVGYVPKRETWFYGGGQPLVYFEQNYPGAPWTQGSSRVKQSNRIDLLRDATDPLADHRHPDPDAPTLAELAPNARYPFMDGWAPSWDEIATAANAEAHAEHFEMPGPPRRFFAYVFDADVFRGAPRRPRVEVHVQFDLQDLAFELEDASYVAHFGVEGVLLDDSVRVAARADYRDSVLVDAIELTQRSILWPGQLDFAVEPGAYRLALRVVDLRTNAEGIYAADVRVPSLDAGGLLLSDIELATRIDSLTPGQTARFAKRDRLVVPNPIAMYQPGKQLTGYFEIYGLQLDSEQRSHYQVTYTLAPRTLARDEGWFPSDKPRGKPVVSSSFTGEGRDATVLEELRVDVAALDEDIYDLLLTVRDLQAGTEATARSHFRVGR